MEFPQALIRGTLISRYKRFFADIRLADDSIVTAHCPNTGSMKSCGEAGDTVLLQQHHNPKRRLAYTWEFTETPGGYIGVNTLRTNHLVAEALTRGTIPELQGYDSVQREVRLGPDSRIDFLLSRGHEETSERCWVEVKNVTYRHDDIISFPDAPTLRGSKHLRLLAATLSPRDRCVLLYVINRPDGRGFQPLAAIDPNYFKEMGLARKAGVEFLAYRTQVCSDPAATRIELGRRVEILPY